MKKHVGFRRNIFFLNFGNFNQELQGWFVKNLKAVDGNYISRFPIRMWLRKCSIGAVEGAVEFGGLKHFADFSRHSPQVFEETCNITPIRSLVIYI